MTMEAKKNEFTGLLKDKKIATKKEIVTTKTGENKSKGSFQQRALASVRNVYLRFKKFFRGSNKFLFFLFSVTLFIAGPLYINYLNTQLFNYIRVNGGIKREQGPMGGMRPY